MYGENAICRRFLVPKCSGLSDFAFRRFRHNESFTSMFAAGHKINHKYFSDIGIPSLLLRYVNTNFAGKEAQGD